MAGCSGTPLVRKIGVRQGQHLVLVGAPDGWVIEGLPGGVRVSRVEAATTDGPPADVRASAEEAAAAADVVVAFFRALAALDRAVPRLAGAVVPDGALWLAWPRRADGHASDITDNGVRAVVLPLGLVDVKVAALDDDWSALKFVWRKERRADRT